MVPDEGSRRVSPFLIAGAGVGLAGVLLFGVVHAVTIVPIWDRLWGGVPLAVGAGVAMGWAFFELRGVGRFVSRMGGPVYGALLWLVLLPMTVAGVGLRESGLHSPQDDTWEVLLALGLVVGTGASLGWTLSRRWRVTLALTIAGLALAMTQGGPVAATNSPHALAFFVGLSFIYPLSGLALALFLPVVETRLMAVSRARG